MSESAVNDWVKPNSLADLLRKRAAVVQRPWDITLLHAQGDLPADLQVDADDRKLQLSYADLLSHSERAAKALLASGVRQGDRVVLVLPTGLAWLAAFFGCELLGATPVPLVPPWSLDQLSTHIQRIARVVEICEAALMVGEARLLDALDGASSQAVERTVLQRVKRLSSKDLFEKLVGEMAAVTIDESEPAFIQFTSGSTSEPKGVVISQRAALANCEYIAERIGLTPDDVGCSWLPLFHDMGLIGHVLVPLLVGTRSVLLPPEVFARQPRTWLEAVTQYRATIITAPNSAYDVCSSKIAERDLATLDLSSVRAALCGAEPILATTLQRFQARFGRAGFRSTSFVPVYGLAEATLAVALAQCDQQLRIERLDRDALQTRGHAVSRPVDDADVAGSCVDLVSVGRARRVGEVRIVDDHGQPVPERQVGSIEVAGPSVMSGYFTDAAASREALRDGFVRTGDLGFLAEGELFVVGRSKETIIKGGRNLYPYDIEAAASQVEGIRAGRVAAFGIRNATTGTEDLVVVCETKWPRSRHKELARAVTAAVFAATAIRIDTLRLVEPGVLLKTSSGKLRRNAVRERLENGTLQRMSASWSSRVGAVLAKVRRWGGRGGERRG